MASFVPLEPPNGSVEPPLTSESLDTFHLFRWSRQMEVLNRRSYPNHLALLICSAGAAKWKCWTDANIRITWHFSFVPLEPPNESVVPPLASESLDTFHLFRWSCQIEVLNRHSHPNHLALFICSAGAAKWKSFTAAYIQITWYFFIIVVRSLFEVPELLWMEIWSNLCLHRFDKSHSEVKVYILGFKNICAT